MILIDTIPFFTALMVIYGIKEILFPARRLLVIMDACKECKREPARKGKDLCPGCMPREVRPTRRELEEAIREYAFVTESDPCGWDMGTFEPAFEEVTENLEKILDKLFPGEPRIIVTGQASEWDA